LISAQLCLSDASAPRVFRCDRDCSQTCVSILFGFLFRVWTTMEQPLLMLLLLILAEGVKSKGSGNGMIIFYFSRSDPDPGHCSLTLIVENLNSNVPRNGNRHLFGGIQSYHRSTLLLLLL
jgi:hypothetical protein